MYRMHLISLYRTHRNLSQDDNICVWTFILSQDRYTYGRTHVNIEYYVWMHVLVEDTRAGAGMAH